MASTGTPIMNFGDIKSFLYAWLGRQNKLPCYTVNQQGTKQRIRFKCEVGRFHCHYGIVLIFTIVNCFHFSVHGHR